MGPGTSVLLWHLVRADSYLSAQQMYHYRKRPDLGLGSGKHHAVLVYALIVHCDPLLAVLIGLSTE